MSWSSGPVNFTQTESDARYAQLGAANVFTTGVQDVGAGTGRGIKFGAEVELRSTGANALRVRQANDAGDGELYLRSLRGAGQIIGGTTSPVAGLYHYLLNNTAASVALAIRGAAAQAGDILQYQDSAATVLGSVSAAGAVLANNGSATAPGFSFQGDSNTGMFGSGDVINFTTAGSEKMRLGTVIRLLSTMSIGWTTAMGSSSDAVLSRAAAGQIEADLFKWKAANEQTTVGAAGAASALPATPSKYFKVIDSAGTTFVVPGYVAA